MKDAESKIWTDVAHHLNLGWAVNAGADSAATRNMAVHARHVCVPGRHLNVVDCGGLDKKRRTVASQAVAWPGQAQTETEAVQLWRGGSWT